ncbi:nesprin-3 isoform X2 [Trichomycterus rosablanca]|uniref:nesprin-3 isoform X2 n=1 Tax=Trichomycterus rosablanca TaxID=2290929 RepID=UPI002F3539A9
MTQQEKQDFRESCEEALTWMRAVQERLRLSDNTDGPRAALETRLRETEKIHESAQEGRMKIDVVLAVADALLKNGDEELKNQTHSKLKELKAMWEETSTYIVHCHSRIEWVWLHWSEYLKAHEEFGIWLVRVQRSVEPQLELQLDLREKLWQVEHRRVICSDVRAQEPLLERLLDEASTLFNRTQDPSVDERAQNALSEAYSGVRSRAEEMLALVQKVAEEHQQYQSHVQDFHKWLVSKTEEVSRFNELEEISETRLQALEELDASVAREEETLRFIEGVSQAVKTNTSPAGAEQIRLEVEELRTAWQRLRLTLAESHDDLKSSLDARCQYDARREELAGGIGRLRALVQELSQKLESKDGDRNEENVVAQWKIYTGVRTALMDEEPEVERLKSQLKELYRFPYDSGELADEVLTAVKEFQSVKGRSFRLCSESETALKQLLQDPLHGFSQWSRMVSQVLDNSSEVTEFSHIAVLVQNIEKLLKHSVQLQERLGALQVKADLMGALFGEEKAESLLEELGTDVRRREQLHGQLLQRKNHLQGLISRTKDFGDAYDFIQNKLLSIQERFLAATGLQPDILAKKSQADQLKVIKKDLEDCEAHITALETLVSSSSTNRTKFERLYVEWKLLYKAVRAKVNEGEESVLEHENFHDSMLNVEKWLMIMRQKLESFRGPDGDWSVENRQHEAERALGEFPEKELQLHRTEVQGNRVLLKTSDEGKVHIQRDLKRLRESWMALLALSHNLYRLLNGHAASGETDSSFISQRGLDDLSLDQPEGVGFIAGSGSKIKIRPDYDLGLAEGSGIQLVEGPGRGSGFKVVGRSVTKHDDSSQTEDADFNFSVGGGAGLRLDRTPSKNIQTIKGGSTADDVDSAGEGRGIQYYREGKGGGDVYGVGMDIRSGFGSRSRTTEWIEYRSSGVEDLDLEGTHGLVDVDKGRIAYAGDQLRFMNSDEDMRMKFKPPAGTSALGSKDLIQAGLAVRGRSSNWDSLWREFEVWFLSQNNKLTEITTDQRALSTKDLKIRQKTLQELRAGVPWGQERFQHLLTSGPETGLENVELEELRYKWMLYKSKLKEAEVLQAPIKPKNERSLQQEELVRDKKSVRTSDSVFVEFRFCRM